MWRTSVNVIIITESMKNVYDIRYLPAFHYWPSLGPSYVPAQEDVKLERHQEDVLRELPRKRESPKKAFSPPWDVLHECILWGVSTRSYPGYVQFVSIQRLRLEGYDLKVTTQRLRPKGYDPNAIIQRQRPEGHDHDREEEEIGSAARCKRMQASLRNTMTACTTSGPPSATISP